MSHARRARLGLSAVALAMVAAVGVATGVLMSAPAAPASLRDAEQAVWVPVTQREFDDARAVELNLAMGAAMNLTAPTSGTVTASSCRPGGQVVAGESAVAVDGVPIVNVATAVPLWRDLPYGASGEDVDALVAELGRLGFVVGDSDRVDRAVLTAVSDLFDGVGARPGNLSAVPAARFLWLPQESVTVESCTLSTGAPMAQGEPVATIPGALTAATVALLPDGAAPGERRLTVDGILLTVDGNGTVSSPEDLQELTASPSVVQALRADMSSVAASYALAESLTVSVLPPAALYDVDGQAACVEASDGVEPVHIVGSELGQSFVQFAGNPAADVALDPTGAASCR